MLLGFYDSPITKEDMLTAISFVAVDLKMTYETAAEVYQSSNITP